jgi:glutathione S-transferase
VRIATAMKGLSAKVEFIDPDKQAARADALRAGNPLGKIPTAKLDDGTLVYDSHVICEYLDGLAPSPVLFPASGAARLKTMTLAALSDGLSEAAILIVYEGRFRPKEKWHQEWVDKQQVKIDASLAELEANVPTTAKSPRRAR